MPKLSGGLFKFIQKQPPEVFILLLARKLKRCSYIEISHKIRKENTCVSLFSKIY